MHTCFSSAVPFLTNPLVEMEDIMVIGESVSESLALFLWSSYLVPSPSKAPFQIVR